MKNKQLNILIPEVTERQLQDLAKWWNLWWNDRPYGSAIVRECIERAWADEMVKRERAKIAMGASDGAER